MLPIPPIAADNQRRLSALRGVSLAATLALSLLARPLFHVLPSLPVLLGICALWGIFMAFAWFRQGRNLGEAGLFFHLCMDIAFLTAWLAFYGGSANPLTVLYLLPVAAAAALLRPPLAWAAAAAALGAYSLLWIIAVPLTVEDVDQAMRMHLAGMWLTFSLSAAMLVGIVAQMSRALRERERHLAAAHERMLRDERIVALGSLAAGAAHALGTPLNTLTLLADEIVAGAPAGSTLAEDARELQTQVGRCRDIVNGLLSDTTLTRADGGEPTLEAWLTQLLKNFRQLRPESAPQLDVEPEIATRAASADPALAQAILHLLDNAADSGARHIVVRVETLPAQAQVAVTVSDDGAGFSPDALARIGREPYSDKPRGMGLGLYLANATAERLGGRLICANFGQGAQVRLSLPMDAWCRPS